MKTLFDLESYRARFLGGAKQYLFFVLFQFPDDINNNNGNMSAFTSVLNTFGLGAEQDMIPYLVKSTNLPSISNEESVNPHTDFDFKTAGLFKYDDWTVSLYIDKKGVIIEKFYDWLKLSEYGALPKDYMREQEIHLIDYMGSTFLKYKLYGAWVKSIGQIGLDYASTDIATVEITLSFQYFDIERGSTEDASLIKKAVEKLTGIFL